MITRFLPWKFLIKRTAKRYGIIDPFRVAARVRRFAQPSEIQEPIELLRAGIVFHARGLINSRAIQYNLDWVWPFWVERQFNPKDPSFIPRAFSFSHVNLTHRNWTAVGYPDMPVYPIVDPQGLFTPLYDGWSLDCWIICEDGTLFLPSRRNGAEQIVSRNPGLRVETVHEADGFSLRSVAGMEHEGSNLYASLDVSAAAPKAGWLVVGIRPYNPEGIQFIENISFEKGSVPYWLVNRKTRVYPDEEPEKVLFSTYREGDVIHKRDRAESESRVHCGVGLATSAAFFRIGKEGKRVRVLTDISAAIPHRSARPDPNGWENHLENAARLMIPDERLTRLYDSSLQTLLLLSAEEVVPGPYTYFRFWFRDACLMIHCLLGVNLLDRAFERLDTFPERRKWSGYFQSQEGEWDSNGQVLWIMERYLAVSGKTPSPKWLDAVYKGGMWIEKKRIRRKTGRPHEGLLPAGFSAEHLGPNDYYYWDDFWGLAGLRAAARIHRAFASPAIADRFDRFADDFEQTIFSTIDSIPSSRSEGCIPASPYRRMDAGAVGSLVADYPLQLVAPGDTRIINTVNYLVDNCFFEGAFFQDMIHSGVNAYLTLDIAQSMLRHGDGRYRRLIERVAELASPTGHWPEAIHPRTGGGCMGDGQHGWAAAEYLMMIRSLFVREETGRLIIGQGIFPEWIDSGGSLLFGPTATSWGTVSVRIEKAADGARVYLEASWLGEPPQIDIRLPGFVPETGGTADGEGLCAEVRRQ